ncbi:hypothetical protein T45_04486 [Streptomyces turgidiscabies]|nr:hypothetical protein T45_04486 [Streptomyces turgidiscabies]
MGLLAAGVAAVPTGTTSCRDRQRTATHRAEFLTGFVTDWRVIFVTVGRARCRLGLRRGFRYGGRQRGRGCRAHRVAGQGHHAPGGAPAGFHGDTAARPSSSHGMWGCVLPRPPDASPAFRRGSVVARRDGGNGCFGDRRRRIHLVGRGRPLRRVAFRAARQDMRARTLAGTVFLPAIRLPCSNGCLRPQARTTGSVGKRLPSLSSPLAGRPDRRGPWPPTRQPMAAMPASAPHRAPGRRPGNQPARGGPVRARTIKEFRSRAGAPVGRSPSRTVMRQEGPPSEGNADNGPDPAGRAQPDCRRRPPRVRRCWPGRQGVRRG